MMNGRRRARGLTAAAAVLGAAGAAAIALAAGTQRVESAWGVEAPVIDGRLTEWSSPLAAVESAPLSLGVRNDGQYLHVALAASDPSMRMMLGLAGFTVWIDRSGKEKKSFGIAVPAVTAGGRGARGGWFGGGQPAQQGAPAEPGREGQRESGQPGFAAGTITSIEVHGSSRDDMRRFELAYARTIGIDAAARVAEGVLVYELLVPLAVSETRPYGVGSGPGATIGLGIESGQPARPGGRGEEGGRSRGGMGSGGGGRGGGMGGSMMGGGPSGGGREGMRDLKPVKLWIAAGLAKAPA